MNASELAKAVKVKPEIPSRFPVAPGIQIYNHAYEFKYGSLLKRTSVSIDIPLGVDNPAYPTAFTPEQVATINEIIAKTNAWDRNELSQDDLWAFARGLEARVAAEEVEIAKAAAAAAKKAKETVAEPTAAERVDDEPFQS